MTATEITAAQAVAQEYSIGARLILDVLARVKRLNELFAHITPESLVQIEKEMAALRPAIPGLHRAGVFDFITPLECLLSERMPGRIALCALLLQTHPHLITKAVKYRIQALAETVSPPLRAELLKCEVPVG